MHFTKYLVTGAALLCGVSTVLANTDVDIKFHKWDDNYECAGDEAGDHDTIDDGHCKSFDHHFISFMYKKKWFNTFMFWHNDYTDPSCELIIYQGSNCEGLAWTPGVLAMAYEQCLKVPEAMGSGHSASVLCNVKTGIERFVDGPEFRNLPPQ